MTFGRLQKKKNQGTKEMTNHFRKLHQNPDFILMYINTIYILNNIILECFDIDFKGKKQKRQKILYNVIL